MRNVQSAPVRFGWKRLREKVPGDALGKIHLHTDESLEAQSYRIEKTDTGIRVSAGDDAGMMYGLLDLADMYNGGWPESIRIFQRPYLQNRGIKLNIPLDARTPSYSDASSSAFENIGNMWEFSFWREFLDSMAEQKYNVLSLWNLSPFPSLVRVPEYPLIGLEDVVCSTVPPRPDMSGDHMWTPDMAEGAYAIRRMTIDEKMDFWRRVMQYAQDRCIRVYLFTWNLFVYGTEGNPYGITCCQSNPITADYLRCSVRALLEAYPLLAGIGITSGENMAGDETDIPFLRNTYGRAVEEYCAHNPGRSVELIHRMQYARYGQIQEQYQNFKGSFSVSFKYSQAHIHSDARPAFFTDFLKNCPGEERFWLTLRDDDYYFYRWYDYGFARELLRRMPVERVQGFYLGADGFTWGRDYTGYDSEHPLYIQKMWGKLGLFGQLSYNPDKPEEFFVREMEKRFGREDAARIAEAWTLASSGFRILQAVHWNDYDFQWYPEGCCRFLHPPVGKLVFCDVNEFMSRPAMPGTPYQSVREYCENGRHGTKEKPRTPMAAVRHLRRNLRQMDAILASLRPEGNRERTAVLTDIQAMYFLTAYYADKLQAAIELCCFRQDRSKTQYRQRAVRLLKSAAQTWKRYSAFSRAHYRPQRLTRMGGNLVDFTAFDRGAEEDVNLALYQ